MNPELKEKAEALKSILRDMGKVVVAFSGGVDSTFLLKMAQEVLGDNVYAIIADSKTYPQAERENAVLLAKDMDVAYEVIHSHELENPEFVKNSPQRCYYCKTELFLQIKKIAEERDIPYVLDGSNFEDTKDFRPGAQAAHELGVRSPLKETGFLKDDIRQLSKILGLPTWNKPSMACLSSRFPYYTMIDDERLSQVAKAENYLKSLGFSQLRVRHHDTIARIEISKEEIEKLLSPEFRENIVKTFKQIGYTYVTVDLSGYRSGSMNEALPAEMRK